MTDEPRSYSDAIEERRRVRCFMDGIDWQHELGEAGSGTRLYPTAEDARAGEKCIDTGGCGIVEVEIRLIRWVEPQKLKGATILNPGAAP